MKSLQSNKYIVILIMYGMEMAMESTLLGNSHIIVAPVEITGRKHVNMLILLENGMHKKEKITE